MKATSKATPKEPHGWELRGVECIACGNTGDIKQYFPCCDCAKALRKRVGELERLLRDMSEHLEGSDFLTRKHLARMAEALAPPKAEKRRKA